MVISSLKTRTYLAEFKIFPILLPSFCLVTYLESLFVIATHTKEPNASTFLTVTFDSTLGKFIGADMSFISVPPHKFNAQVM